MNDKIRAAIVGSTGYGGVELIRFLLQHPDVVVTSVISSSSAGQPIADGFPHLHEIMVENLDDVDIPLIRSKADVVFTATPSGVSSELVPRLLEAGLKVIDLSGDFRLKSGEVYEHWYKHKAPDSSFLKQAVFGLAEIYSDKIKGAHFISNPGCYPTAALLGLIPAVKSGWIDLDSIIIDAKSGVSGAGRKVGLGVHYAEVNENLSAYKINKHQHIPEIEQTLSEEAGKEIITTFTTHLIPMTRGIMCTMYAKLIQPPGGQGFNHDKQSFNRSEQDFISLYREFYEGRRFVRIRNQGKWPATKEVWGSNYCDIGFAVDERTNRLTIVSVIDNVVKGAAGQAIQNLNLMMGWPEQLGLEFSPVYP